MANDFDARFVRRMRWSLSLVLIGLAVQVATLMRAHPYTFLGFLFAGTGLALIGALAFVWAWRTR